MQRIPKRVTVGAMVYRIRCGSRAQHNAEDRSEGQKLSGQADHPRAQIVVCRHDNERYQQCTLTHELLHCLWYQCGLPPKHEEDTVTRLAPALLDLLQRNPRLVAYLTTEETKTDG